jgi:hypothetical protein
MQHTKKINSAAPFRDMRYPSLVPFTKMLRASTISRIVDATMKYVSLSLVKKPTLHRSSKVIIKVTVNTRTW